MRLACVSGAMLLVLVNIVWFGAYLKDAAGHTDAIFGGDYVVFHEAGRADVAADPDAVYDARRFAARQQEALGLSAPIVLPWIYPPSMLFFTELPARFSLEAGYFIWEAQFLALFLLALWRIWPNPVAILIVAASPAVFRAVITGQNGLLTSALLAFAVMLAARKPVGAGAAAALLTVKPQFGLLLPVAYAAGKHWRAFVFAAFFSAAFFLASVIVYGPGSWSAFLDALSANPARFGEEGSPLDRMMAPFGAAMHLGAPRPAAIAVQICATLLIVAYTGFVFSKTREVNVRLVAIATAAPLATPYALHYDTAILAPGLFALARLASEKGWLPSEKIGLLILFLAPEFSPLPPETKIPFPFVIAAVAALLGARRTMHEIGRTGVMSASATPLA
jgi:hypothetical protein